MSDSNKYANVDYRLKNLTNALYLTGDDDVALRTGITGNIIIEGNVNVPGNVNVVSTPENPVHTHLTEVGTSGILAVPYMPVGGNVNATVAGNVNIGTMPEVEIKNDTGNPIAISKNTTTNSEDNPIWVKGTSDTSFFAPTQSDAFGRLRVSNPYTLFDSFHRYQDNGKIIEYTSGTASSSFDANSGTITMTVGTTNGDKIYRESGRVFSYQPGKSLLVLQTFCMATGKANLKQRQGYFDTANGFFIQQLGTQLSFVRRSSSTGSVQDWVINQADWNVDTLGAGALNPSGVTLDITKTQILWMDVEWLGVGSVRMGFVIDGEFIHCHTFHHANRTISGIDTTLTYMTTACLPVRAELENVGGTVSSSTYRLICTSVISEGGYELIGRPLSVGHPLSTPVTLPNDQSFKPVMSIRLKSTRMGAIVLPTNFSFSPVAQSVFKYQIYADAVTSGGSWVSAGANSSVEYNLAPTSLVSGTLADSSFLITSNQSSAAPSLSKTPFRYQLTRNTFTGTCYEFVIMAATTGTNQDVYGSVGWEELT